MDIHKVLVFIKWIVMVITKHLVNLMRAIVSLLVLGAALYIILSNRYDSGAQNFAFCIIGTIICFWLMTQTKESD